MERGMEVERALTSLMSLTAAQPSLCLSCASLAPPPAWFSPPCLAPAFPLFLGSINASLHPMALFVLTEHPRSSQAARLLHGAVFPSCLFPTQAQGAQIKSEFNRGLGRLSVSAKDKVSEAGLVSRPARVSRPRYAQSSIHTPQPRAGDLGVVLSSSFCHYLSRAPAPLLPKPLAQSRPSARSPPTHGLLLHPHTPTHHHCLAPHTNLIASSPCFKVLKAQVLLEKAQIPQQNLQNPTQACPSLPASLTHEAHATSTTHEGQSRATMLSARDAPVLKACPATHPQPTLNGPSKLSLSVAPVEHRP